MDTMGYLHQILTSPLFNVNVQHFNDEIPISFRHAVHVIVYFIDVLITYVISVLCVVVIYFLYVVIDFIDVVVIEVVVQVRKFKHNQVHISFPQFS
jgi:hypothetical protein